MAMGDFEGVDALLRRLSGVKKAGNGRWFAYSPTRKEKTASLSIRLKEDGLILIHDFGGASVPEVLDALGLDWGALIPPHLRRAKVSEKGAAYGAPNKPAFSAYDAIRALEEDATIILIVANRIMAGEPVSDDDLRYVARACERISDARQFVGA